MIHMKGSNGKCIADLTVNELWDINNLITKHYSAMSVEKYNTIEMARCGKSKMDEITIININNLLAERLEISEMFEKSMKDQESEYWYRAILAINERIKFILAL